MNNKILLFTVVLVSTITLTNCEENAAQETIKPKTLEQAEKQEQVEVVSSKSNTSAIYQIKAPKINSDLNFCNELVPIDQAFIYEKIDRELLVNMYWQSQTFLFIKRAHKWFPIIEPILEKNNIPDDFKYLAVIESGLMNVTSPSGAKGFWQFMPKTARGHQLEVNEFVDERYKVELATQTACEYLNQAYKKFNNWTLAAASYNMGKSGLERRLAQQQVNSYYDLLLNQETGRYIYRILAAKEILSKPIDYGFHLEEDDYYTLPTYNEIKIDTTINDLVQFSVDMGITYKELKALNPWLRDKSLPNENHKVYSIKILK